MERNDAVPRHAGAALKWALCAAGAMFASGCGESGDPRLRALQQPVAAEAAALPAPDQLQPRPATGFLTRKFARDVPEVAVFERDAALAEHAAVEAARAKIRGAPRTPAAAPRKSRPGAAVPRRWPTAAVGDASAESPALALGVAFGFLGHNMVPTGASSGGPVTGQGSSGDLRGAVTMEAAAGTDGTNLFGMTVDINAAKDGKSLQVKAGGRIEGNPCPDPEGKVTVKYRLTLVAQGAAGNKRAGSSQELEGTATVSVDDSATMTSLDFDVHAQHSRQRPESHDAFVDFRASGSISGGAFGGGPVKVSPGPLSVVREGSKTTREDWDSMSLESQQEALRFLVGYFYMLEKRWRDGACVDVRADVPGKVKPGSTTKFDVSVVQKLDGAPIKAPVDASIVGQASLEPKRISPAPGTETYVAGTKPGSVATLKFVSTSRRGIGRLEATVKAGDRGYSAKGGPGISITGTICGGVDQPFTLDGRPPDGSSITFSYKPSGQSGGALTYTGRGGMFTMSGKGSYTIKPGGGDTLVMTQTHSGCVTNVPFGGCRTYTETITLTPADCGS